MEIAGQPLPEGSWWDWEVVTWDAGRLVLAAGHDLTYHHGLEVVFVSPLFVSCPPAFQDPVFRAPTAGERERLARTLGEESPVVVAFEADGGGRDPVSCLVAAERVDVVPGLFERARCHGTEAPVRPPDWPGAPPSTD
ncbi:hypothetical protein [Streptomyces sp. NPDC047024]|uniref:hypothetical protein n=1 Tax=Streptomyces sp. NPDC047024 TaxID=3155476 RepID=UPI0033EA547E